MLNRVRHLDGCAVVASDGEVGRLRDVFFDDERWTIRHLMVDTGNWLSRHAVLVSPNAVRRPLGTTRRIELGSTRSEIASGPEVDGRERVSGRNEMAVLGCDGDPGDRGTTGLRAVGGHSDLRPPSPAWRDAAGGSGAGPVGCDDGLLCSCAHVRSFVLHARDGSVGHVEDFVFDEDSWAIQYFVVRVRRWPGGARVLVATRWIERVDWDGRGVHAGLTLEEVEACVA